MPCTLEMRMSQLLPGIETHPRPRRVRGPRKLIASCSRGPCAVKEPLLFHVYMVYGAPAQPRHEDAAAPKAHVVVIAGSGPAVAEANALHKGPVVFHIPQPLLRQLRRGAAAGDHDLMQLELDLFRQAGFEMRGVTL